MILSEMETALMRYGFDTSDPLLTWLNWGMYEVTKEREWRFLEQIDNSVLLAGNPAMSWIISPITIKKILSIKIIGQADPLRFVGPAQWHREVSDPTSTGTPQIYKVVHTTTDRVFTTVWPTPTMGYTTEMVYKVKEIDLVNPGDSPVYIPSELHSAIVVRAAAFGMEAEDEQDRATGLMNTFASLIANAISDDDDTAGPSFVEDVMNYGC